MSFRHILQKSAVREFILFSIVGLSGVLVELIFFNIFIYLNVPILLAATLAMPIAASSNWKLNRQFTFKTSAINGPFAEWLRYMVASAAGWALNLILFTIIYKKFSAEANLAKLTATAIVWLWNYSASKFWTFRGR